MHENVQCVVSVCFKQLWWWKIGMWRITGWIDSAWIEIIKRCIQLIPTFKCSQLVAMTCLAGRVWLQMRYFMTCFFSLNSTRRRSISCCSAAIVEVILKQPVIILMVRHWILSHEVLYLHCYRRVTGILRSVPNGWSKIEDLWLDD